MRGQDVWARFCEGPRGVEKGAGRGSKAGVVGGGSAQDARERKYSMDDVEIRFVEAGAMGMSSTVEGGTGCS